MKDHRTRLRQIELAPVAYPAILNKDTESDYSLHFPDLPGCVTAGRTIEEALFAAREALTAHLEVLVELRRRPPRPTSLYDLERSPNRGEGVAVMIEPWPAAKEDEPVPVQIKLTARQMRGLDSVGASVHKTRDQLIEAAVAAFLEEFDET
jgi:predicted RNase H-like HicB family nuclease